MKGMLGNKPAARGWGSSGRRTRYPAAIEALFEPREYYVLEPDFDDDDLEHSMSLWRHQIETTGSIWLHPNANFYEPPRVPLCSHVPDGDHSSCEFVSIPRYRRRIAREKAEHAAWEKIWRGEDAERKKQREVEDAKQIQAAIAQRRAGLAPPWEPPWQPKQTLPPWEPPPVQGPPAPSEMMADTGPMVEALRALNIKLPVAPGDGRVWRDYVMVNKFDAPAVEHKWAKVWTGADLVVFRMGLGANDA